MATMSENIKKIGLLGGTFDPIHLGHLHLANEILTAHNLDEIWFVPVQINPHKQGTHPVDPKHRLRMIQLAIKNNPQFKVEPIELHRPAPSYTIDTLNALHEKYSNVNFYLILGEDALHSLMQWKDIFKVLDAATLIVGTRKSSSPPDLSTLDPAVANAIKQGYTPIKPLDISSTEIRRRLKEGEDCSEMVPVEVFDYIKENMLYS